MFSETIPGKLKSNLESLGKREFIKQFYLAGGTAIALRLGHRISYDLDFFTPEDFNEREIVAEIEKIGKIEIDVLKEDTLVGKLNETKISFFFYRYKLIAPSQLWLEVDTADTPDLGCMKLDAIQSRGKKRDFVDLWAILRSGLGLKDLLNFFEEKYAGVKYNKIHLLRSLSYFEDAEKDDMPHMLTQVSWEEIKRYLENETKSFLKGL